MQQELSDKNKKFLEKTAKHRKEKVEELAFKALAVGLKENLPVFDLPYYVLQKTKEILINAYKDVDFNDKKLIKMRKEFARYCLAQMRGKVKLPEKIKGENLDETQLRDNRCIPVVAHLVEELLKDELVFSDEDYFTETLKDEEGVPLMSAISGYGEALDEKLLMVVSEHWKRSVEKLWGVDKESVTFEMMDEILKRP